MQQTWCTISYKRRFEAARSARTAPAPRFTCALVFWVDDIAPGQVAALETLNEHLGRGHIGRKGHVVLIAQARNVVDAVVLRDGGVAEIQDQVQLVIGNTRADLLITTLISGKV